MMRAVRALRGGPTRAFEPTNHRPTPPAGPDVRQQTQPEAPTVAAPDQLPFAPPVAGPPAPEGIDTASVVEATPASVPPGENLTAEAPATENLPAKVAATEIPSTASVDSPTWAAPVDGECPDGYPVKAKLRSGIFHLPGMSAYDRTTPDRCYPDADAATADGLRVARR